MYKSVQPLYLVLQYTCRSDTCITNTSLFLFGSVYVRVCFGGGGTVAEGAVALRFQSPRLLSLDLLF